MEMGPRGDALLTLLKLQAGSVDEHVFEIHTEEHTSCFPWSWPCTGEVAKCSHMGGIDRG